MKTYVERRRAVKGVGSFVVGVLVGIPVLVSFSSSVKWACLFTQSNELFVFLEYFVVSYLFAYP